MMPMLAPLNASNLDIEYLDTSLSSINILPVLALVKPPNRFNKVDFPIPDFPSINNLSPEWHSKSGNENVGP